MTCSKIEQILIGSKIKFKKVIWIKLFLIMLKKKKEIQLQSCTPILLGEAL